jgi:hypothetical protein
VTTAVLIPSYGRPDSVKRVVADLDAAKKGVEFNAYVIAEADDEDTHRACGEASAWLIVNDRARSYAGAVNTAFAATSEPFLFLAADDLHFTDGWLDRLIEVASTNETLHVFGTNDLGNPDVLAGTHATHYLLRRRYIEAVGGSDEPGVVLHEGYRHNYTDTELVESAKARGVFAPVLDSVVEHLHPCWGKASWDETYQKMLAGNDADAQLFAERRHLWTR